eukprot:11661157-Ditylum_brightwellii.AAC.2
MEPPVGMTVDGRDTYKCILMLNKSTYGLRQSTTKQSISGFIKSLREGDKNFEFTEEGTVENYFGVMIRRSGENNNRSFKLCEPYLIKKAGYIFFYAGCPVLLLSKMQTEMALSTTEAEYIALSTAIRE